jgi:hypothetical protein
VAVDEGGRIVGFVQVMTSCSPILPSSHARILSHLVIVQAEANADTGEGLVHHIAVEAGHQVPGGSGRAVALGCQA